MKIYIYSSHPTKPAAPYLFLAQQTDPQPPHPSGKTWTFWKQAELAPNIIGVDPVQAAAEIATNGYFIR